MTDNQETMVWDIAIRLFHWALVVGFFVAYLTEDEMETLHVWAGYLVTGLLIFRVMWGFVGSKYARFGNFLYGPEKIVSYARAFITGNPPHYLGHNPVGGVMVMLLLGSAALACWTGLEAYAVEGNGPLAEQHGFINNAYANSDEEKDNNNHDIIGNKYEERGEKKDELWEELHEATANLALFLVILHIIGVFIASIVHGENLILAMLTGKKRMRE